MMKRKTLSWLITAVAGIGVATAQGSPKTSSSGKSASDPLQAATKPLTPKSETSSTRRRPPVGMPVATTKTSNRDAELNRLESQNIHSTGTKNAGSPRATKVTPITSTATSSKAGSGINATYKAPATPKKN